MKFAQWPIIKPFKALFESRAFLVLLAVFGLAVLCAAVPPLAPYFVPLATVAISVILKIGIEDASKNLATMTARGPTGLGADLLNAITNTIAPPEIKSYAQMTDDALSALVEGILSEMRARNLSKLGYTGPSTPPAPPKTGP